MSRKRRSWALGDDELRTLGFVTALILVAYWGFRTPSPETIIAGLVATLLTGLRLMKGRDNGDDTDEADPPAQLGERTNTRNTGLDPGGHDAGSPDVRRHSHGVLSPVAG